MRISFTSMSYVFNPNTHIQTVISKIDKRVTLVAVLLFAAIGWAIYQYSKRGYFEANPQFDDEEKMNGLAQQKLDSKEVEIKSDREIALQTQYPDQKILSDTDFEQAKKAKKTWMLIHDKVYDLTSFVEEHPAGEDILIKNSGQDASKAFDDMGHSDYAKELMRRYYYIGVYGGTKLLKSKP